jgi:WD40 repeat protein
MRLPFAFALCLACTHAAPSPVVVPPEPSPPEPEPAPVAPTYAEPTSPPAPGGLVFGRAHRRGVHAASFDPTGRVLITASGDGAIAVIDVATGRLRASRRAFVRTAQRWVRATSPHEVLVASTGGFFDGTGGVYRWDLHADTWTPLYRPDAPRFVLDRFDVARDGSGHVRFRYDEASSELELVREGEEPVVLAVNANGVMGVSYDEVMPCGERHRSAGSATDARHGSAGSAADGHRGSAGSAADARHGSAGSAADARPRCSRVVSVVQSEPSVISLFDAQTGARLAEVPGALDAFAGTDLWITNHERELVVRSRRDGAVRASAASDAPVLGLRAAGELVLVELEGARWRAFDASTLTPRGEWENVRAIAVAPDGRSVFVAREGTLEHWIVGEGQPRRTSRPTAARSDDPSEIVIDDYVHELLPSPDGATLVVLGADVLVWDVASWSARARIESDAGETSVWGVVWSPDGDELVTHGRAGVERWGVSGVATTSCGSARPPIVRRGGGLTFDGPLCELASGPVGDVYAQPLAHARDGTRVLVQREGGLALFENGALRDTPVPAPSCDGGFCPERLSADRTLSRVAVANERGVIVVELSSGRRTTIAAPRRAGTLGSLRLAPDGRALAELRREPHVVRVVDVATRRERFVVPLPDAQAQVVFSDDGARVAIGSTTAVEVRDARDGSLLTSAPTVRSFRDLRFTPDGKLLVVRGLEELVIVDVEGRDVRRRVEALAPTAGVSEDADRLARCVEGRLIVERLVVARVDDRGPCRLTDELVFSPDGTRLAQREDAVVRVHRLDGPVESARSSPAPEIGDVLVLRTYRTEGQSFPVAEDTNGHFEVDPSALPHFVYREAGGIERGALRPASEGPRVEGMVARFFGR